MADEIIVELVDAVQIIRINRPEKKNALTIDMYESMKNALQSGDRSDDVAVHLITGTEGMFSAGNDLTEFLAFAMGGDRKLEAFEFLKTIALIEKPLIAAVDGRAIGIGTTMLFHCDLVYASPLSRIQYTICQSGDCTGRWIKPPGATNDGVQSGI